MSRSSREVRSDVPATGVVFETSNLFVRRFSEDDAEAFAEIILDPSTTQFLALPPVANRAQAQDLLAQATRPDQGSDSVAFAVCQRHSRSVVGFCGINRAHRDEAEIMYALASARRGRGLGWELAKGLTEYCLRDGAALVSAYVVPENLASIAILQRLGFANLGASKHPGFQAAVLKFARS